MAEEKLIQNNESRLGNMSEKDFRPTHINRNDYNENDGKEYKDGHPDTLGSDDVKGKGTDTGGHGHSVPQYKMTTAVSTQLPIFNGGGAYDVEGRSKDGKIGGDNGRKYLQNISIYSPEKPYGQGDNTINVKAKGFVGPYK